MEDYHDISQLYQSYCSIPAKQYWYILTLHSKPEEYKKLKKNLFPSKISEKEIISRESLLYLYIWNILFFNKYPYQENYLWRNSEHKNIVLSSLYDLLHNNSYRELVNIFDNICSNWPEIRDAYTAVEGSKKLVPNSNTEKIDDNSANNQENDSSKSTEAIVQKELNNIYDKTNFPSSIIVNVDGLKIEFGPSKSGWGIDFKNKSDLNDWIVTRTIFPLLHKIQENSKYTFSATLYSISKDNNIEYNVNKAFGIACYQIEKEAKKGLDNVFNTHANSITNSIKRGFTLSTRQWKIGDLYNAEDKKGIVFCVDETGRHGKIVSLNQAYLQWCTPAAQKKWASLRGSSKEDGFKNTHRILDSVIIDQYPAFLWCKSHGPDWYLPSLNEMKEILHNDCVINALKIHGIHTPSLKNHWTSTEVNSRFAYMLSRKDDLEKSAKEVQALVRAICLF